MHKGSLPLSVRFLNQSNILCKEQQCTKLTIDEIKPKVTSEPVIDSRFWFLCCVRGFENVYIYFFFHELRVRLYFLFHFILFYQDQLRQYFWEGYRYSVSQLQWSRKGQTTTPGTPCPTLYEYCVGSLTSHSCFTTRVHSCQFLALTSTYLVLHLLIII